MNLVPNKQLLLIVPFQSTKTKKKELCLDNKVQETPGDVYCPTCRNEKCVYYSTNKTTIFYDCKKWKACCRVLKIPFRDQKPTNILFGGDGTQSLARKTSRDYEKEKPSAFLNKFFRQSQPSSSEPGPKKDRSYSIYGIFVSTPHWFIQLTRTLEMWGSAEDPILLEEEDDKENSPPETPVSERPTRPPTLLRNCPFGQRIENVPDYVFRNLFH